MLRTCSFMWKVWQHGRLCYVQKIALSLKQQGNLLYTYFYLFLFLLKNLVKSPYHDIFCILYISQDPLFIFSQSRNPCMNFMKLPHALITCSYTCKLMHELCEFSYPPTQLHKNSSIPCLLIMTGRT